MNPYSPCSDERGQESNSRRTRQARVFRFLMLLLEGVAKAALYCAHRTSTFLSCAFCEQEGHLAAPSSHLIRRHEHEDFETLVRVILYPMRFPSRRHGPLP